MIKIITFTIRTMAVVAMGIARRIAAIPACNAAALAVVLATATVVGADPDAPAGVARAATSQTAVKLPDFLSKVQLHNFDGYELTPDGTGVSVYRLPAEVREPCRERAMRRDR